MHGTSNTDSGDAVGSSTWESRCNDIADPGTGFGDLLLSLRTGAGLTQEELAERAAITPRAVSGMERGQVRRPQRATVQRLVAALDLAGPAAEHFAAVARGHRAPVRSLREARASVISPGGPAVVPAQLPSDVYPFHGRDAELAVLTWLMQVKLRRSAGPGVCALTGPAGIGKTALALHWAHQVASNFPDGQLFVDLRGHGRQTPVDPADALTDVLRSLGPNGTAAGSFAERAGQMRSLLAARRLLLILDDARSIDQVRPFLPGSGRSFCVVTSQDHLPGLVARDGAARVPLELFTLDEATALLRSLVPAPLDLPTGAPAPDLDGDGGDTDGDLLMRIAESCARLPLALRIAAERIATHPELSLRDHAVRLERAGPLEVLHTGGDDRSSIRTVLNWSVDQLEPTAQEAFTRLGAHPGRDWDLAAARVLIQRSPEATATVLEELTRLHLVQRIASERYRQHDLLRAFAAERAGRAPDRRRAWLGALAEHYRAAADSAIDLLMTDAGTGADGASHEPDRLARTRDWLRREQENMIAVVLQAHDDELHEHALRLALALRRPLELNGAADEGLDVFRRAQDCASTLNDRPGQADALAALAHQHLRHPCSDPDTAAALFARSLGMARRLGDQPRISQALRGLGDAAVRLDRFVTARSCLTESLQLSERAGDQQGVFLAVLGLAALDHRRGLSTEAIAGALEALHGFRLMGDLHGEMQTRQLLGDARLADQDAHGALAEYRRSRWCAERLGHRAMLARATARAEHALGLLGVSETLAESPGETARIEPEP